MSHRSHTPLDPDERALAERLAADTTAAPSPALDASILQAARRAVAPAPTGAPPASPVAPQRASSTSRRPRRRWPLGAGVAAALLVAVGVAWQLRPVPEMRPEVWSEAPPAPVARAPMASPAETSAPPVMDTEHAPVAPARRQAATPATRPAAPEAAERATSAAPASSSPPSPEAASAAPAPASAVEATRATAFGAGSVVAPQTTAAPKGIAAPAAVAGAPAPSRAETLARRAAPLADAHEDIGDHDAMDADDEPPATADSPQVRAAWLERVRELLDAGDITAARASLAEFHRRHPDADLPPDLRALLD